ncbi:MAG: hypothetical protein R3F59_26010 [Myxococcota bacterium]
MTRALLALALVGCQPAELRAWHGAIEVTSLEAAESDCAAPLAPADPPQRYLFFAVQEQSLADVATLYWCAQPTECDTPYGSVYLSRLTERAAVGDAVSAVHDVGLCDTRWTDLDARRTDAGRVSLTFRTGSAAGVPMTEPECQVFAEDLVGQSCDVVIHVEGRQ